MSRVAKVSWLVAVLVGLGVLGWASVARAQEPRDGDREMSSRLDRLERQVQMLAERGGGPQQFRPPPHPPELGRPPGDAGETRVLWPGHHAKTAFWCVWRMMFAVLALCHVLLAVWVFQDIRKRGEGSGLFIVLALLAGFCGAILYALVRLGDRKV